MSRDKVSFWCGIILAKGCLIQAIPWKLLGLVMPLVGCVDFFQAI